MRQDIHGKVESDLDRVRRFENAIWDAADGRCSSHKVLNALLDEFEPWLRDMVLHGAWLSPIGHFELKSGPWHDKPSNAE